MRLPNAAALALVLTLLSALTLSVGCTLKTGKSEVSNATFRVDHVLGTVDNYSTYKDWAFPAERLFNLTACITDISEKSIIVNHDFEISGGDRTYKATTLTDGCVRWAEVVAFDVFAPPTYIKIERSIKSLGKQRGEVKFAMAINPWSGIIGTEPGVVDLTRDSVSHLVDLKAVPTALKAQDTAPVSLEIDGVDMNMQLDAPNPQQDASLRLEFKPTVVVKDMTGNPTRLPIEKGTFLVQPHLVRLDGNDRKVQILAELPPTAAPMDHGSVVYQVPVKLIHEIDREKTYALVLTVLPQGAPAFVSEYSGVYDIKEVSALHAGHLNLTSAFRKDIKSFKVNEYLPRPTVAAQQRAEDATADKPNAFTLGTIQGMQGGIPTESKMRRQVRLSLAVDVHWTLDLSPAKGRRFRIYAMRENAQDPLIAIKDSQGHDYLTVNDAGMLEWDDSVVHKLYKTQRRTRYEILFEDYLTKQQIKKCAIINPFDFFSTLFRDCNQMTEVTNPTAEKLVSPVPKVPTLKVDGLSIARTDSVIDNVVGPDLSLEVRNRYSLSFDAKILRFDDIRTGLQTAPEPLRGGWWLMTIAMFRNDVAHQRIGDRDANGRLVPITTIEKVICNPSNPAAEVEIKLKELALMDVRSYFAVQFKPLDDDQLKINFDSASPTSQGCLGGEVTADSPIVIDRDNDLMSPPFIFPFTPRSDGGSIVVMGSANMTDPRLKVLNNEIKGLELHQMHLSHLADLEAEKQDLDRRLAQERANGYVTLAQKLGLLPVLIASEPDARNFAGTNGAGLFDALSCLDETFWADTKTQRPHCWGNPANLSVALALCHRLAPPTVSEHGHDSTNYCEDVAEQLVVERRTHVYKLSASRMGAGFSTSLSFSTSAAVGGFNGSDYGNQFGDAFSISGAGEAGANLGLGKGGPVSGNVGVAASASLSKSWSAVNVNFTREWNDNQIGISAGSSLTNEEVDVALQLGEYRECFSVRRKIEPSKGFYVCGPVQNTPVVRNERYYFFYNSGTPAALLNSSDDRQRWLMQFRGDRLYYFMLTTFSTHLAPFHRNGEPYPIVDIIRRIEPGMRERIGMPNSSWGEPFVLASPAPLSSAYDLKDGDQRDMAVIGFHPMKDFGNIPLKDRNVPQSLRKDGDNSSFENR